MTVIEEQYYAVQRETFFRVRDVYRLLEGMRINLDRLGKGEVDLAELKDDIAATWHHVDMIAWTFQQADKAIDEDTERMLGEAKKVHPGNAA